MLLQHCSRGLHTTCEYVNCAQASIMHWVLQTIEALNRTTPVQVKCVCLKMPKD